MKSNNGFVNDISNKLNLDPHTIRSVGTEIFKNLHKVSFTKKADSTNVALEVLYNLGEEAFYHFGGIIYFYLREHNKDDADLWLEFLKRMNLEKDYSLILREWELDRDENYNSDSSKEPDILLNTDVDSIILEIARDDIENNDISSILTSLNSLLESREKVIKFCGRVTIGVEGYDNDPRELFEINEVRSFLKKLDVEFPYWFYFIVRDDGGSNLGFISRCIGEWNKISPGLGNYEGLSFPKFLMNGFAGLNYITETYNIDESVNERISDEVTKILGLGSDKV